MKRRASIFLGFALSAGLLFLALRNVEFGKIASSYSSIKLWHLLVLLFSTCVDLMVRGLRWALLIRPCRKAGAWTVIKLETIGLALNNVLPLRLGEVARATIGSHIIGVPIMTLLATILVERILDVISLATMFALSSKFGANMDWLATRTKMVWIMLAGVICALAFLIFLEELLIRSAAFRAVLNKFPRFGKLIRQIAMGADALRDYRLAAAIISLGFILWFVDAFGYYWVSYTFGFVPLLTFGQGMILLCAGALSVSLPAMPGYFGTFELAIQRVLTAWGYDPNLGMAYATYIHITVYLLMTTLGIIFLYRTGNSLGGIWRSLSNARTCEPKP